MATLSAKNIDKYRKIYQDEDFKVGDFVHRRFWTPPLFDGDCQQPVVEKKPMRIVETFTCPARDKTMFVCGGGKQFLAVELIPSTWRPK